MKEDKEGKETVGEDFVKVITGPHVCGLFLKETEPILKAPHRPLIIIL